MLYTVVQRQLMESFPSRSHKYTRFPYQHQLLLVNDTSRDKRRWHRSLEAGDKIIIRLINRRAWRRFENDYNDNGSGDDNDTDDDNDSNDGNDSDDDNDSNDDNNSDDDNDSDDDNNSNDDNDSDYDNGGGGGDDDDDDGWILYTITCYVQLGYVQ